MLSPFFSRGLWALNPRCLCTVPNDPNRLIVPPIPKKKLQLTFSRSRCALFTVLWKSNFSGPGGQNVNKVNTQAELRFNVKEAYWLGERLRERFLEVQFLQKTVGDVLGTCHKDQLSR